MLAYALKMSVERCFTGVKGSGKGLQTMQRLSQRNNFEKRERAVRNRKKQYYEIGGALWHDEAKLCIALLSRPIISPEEKTFSTVALSLSAFPLVLSAEIEFSQLHSSGRLTMFVPSTILILFWQSKDPVANNNLVKNSIRRERIVVI